ncbi:hypothetical protein EW145_g4291 [Phellinidium pouzarii]|uniref:Uncharacterized protein n=1 Tax=Phellinidium pouzarii TaxID=167371 RepID=A0A4S4L4J3_9AGAM|nr:hypothetical protein EW145_g4291 [Phellinidium pouzarii]
MAHQYFSPRSSLAETDLQDADNELVGDLEQSIFIFPSPGSRSPLSPLSIPTDVSFPSSTTASTPTRGWRSSGIGGGVSGSDWDAVERSSASASTDASLRSPLVVEVWEMSDEGEGEGEGDDDGAEALEEAVARVGRGRAPPMSPIDGQGPDGFPGVKRKAASLPRPSASPQAACRLPVLSFLSTLFALDDRTLHLITRPPHPHSSPLFPGARLHPTSGEGVDSDDTLNEKHQLFRSPELLSMKEGVEVAMDSSITPDNLFALPTLPFVCIWNFVSGIYSVPKKIRMGLRAQI